MSKPASRSSDSVNPGVDAARIQSRVEQLCEDGCRAVNQYIEALRADIDLPQFGGLNAAERRALLRELQAIMAVYGDRCSL